MVNVGWYSPPGAYGYCFHVFLKPVAPQFRGKNSGKIPIQNGVNQPSPKTLRISVLCEIKKVGFRTWKIDKFIKKIGGTESNKLLFFDQLWFNLIWKPNRCVEIEPKDFFEKKWVEITRRIEITRRCPLNTIPMKTIYILVGGFNPCETY